MGREIVLFKSKERKTRQQVADFLRQLAEKIDSGTMLLKQGQEELNLQLPANLILEVEVEDEHKRNKGVQHKLELEIKWYEGEELGPVELG